MATTQGSQIEELEEDTLQQVDALTKAEQEIINANKALSSDRAQNIVAISLARIEELRRRRTTLLPSKSRRRGSAMNSSSAMKR